MKRNLKKIKSILLVIIGIIILSMNLVATTKEDNIKEKIAYLTFDDGPTGEVTEKILDVLKEQDVKATFFVVGKEIVQREKNLKRIYDEGHTIGLHTYSHNLRKIYTSPEVFIEEMKQTENKINEVLGTNLEIKAIRFPGGSSGRLNETFLAKLHEQSYRIYDWTASLEDGVHPEWPACKLYESAKRYKKDVDDVIILAHCNSTNKATYLALPNIIDYYKKQGYTFKPITNDTPEYYYKIKNKCK